MPAAKHPIKYLRTAQKDLLEILDYIAQDNVNAATRLVDEIEEKIGALERHPGIGALPNDPVLRSKGYRVLVIGNYLVFYVVKNKAVEIRRVLHAKRDYRYLLE